MSIFEKYLFTLILLLFGWNQIYCQQKRLSFDVGTAMNYRLLDQPPRYDDYTLKLNAVNERYIALSYTRNNINLGLSGARTSDYQFEWSMTKCDCGGNTYITKTSITGAHITYSPFIGSTVVEPFGGLVYNRILVDFSGLIGTGSPFPFPFTNPDAQALAITKNRIGHRVAMVVGTAIRFKPRTSFIVSAQYGRWISEDPFIEYDIRYFSDDFAYEDMVTESGDQIRVAIGLRFDILSN